MWGNVQLLACGFVKHNEESKTPEGFDRCGTGRPNPDRLSLFVVKRTLLGNHSYAAPCGECEQRDDCSLKIGSVVRFQLAKALIIMMKAQLTHYFRVYKSKLYAGDNIELLTYNCLVLG